MEQAPIEEIIKAVNDLSENISESQLLLLSSSNFPYKSLSQNSSFPSLLQSLHDVKEACCSAVEKLQSLKSSQICSQNSDGLRGMNLSKWENSGFLFNEFEYPMDPISQHQEERSIFSNSLMRFPGDEYIAITPKKISPKMEKVPIEEIKIEKSVTKITQAPEKQSIPIVNLLSQPSEREILQIEGKNSVLEENRNDSDVCIEEKPYSEAYSISKCSRSFTKPIFSDPKSHLGLRSSPTDILKLSKPSKHLKKSNFSESGSSSSFEISSAFPQPVSQSNQENKPEKSQAPDLRSKGQRSTSSSRGKYQILPERLKCQIVDKVDMLIESGIPLRLAIEYVSSFFHCSPKNITRWYKDGVSRKSGAGRIMLDPNLDQKLSDWIRTERKNELPKRIDLRRKALELSSCPDFRASKGWCDKFIQRFKKNLIDEKKETESETRFYFPLTNNNPQFKI